MKKQVNELEKDPEPTQGVTPQKRKMQTKKGFQKRKMQTKKGLYDMLNNSNYDNNNLYFSKKQWDRAAARSTPHDFPTHPTNDEEEQETPLHRFGGGTKYTAGNSSSDE